MAFLLGFFGRRTPRRPSAIWCGVLKLFGTSLALALFGFFFLNIFLLSAHAAELVQTVGFATDLTDPASSVSATLDSAVVPGDTLIVVVADASTSPDGVTGCSDTLDPSSSYVNVDSVSGSSQEVSIWVASDTGGGAAPTVTCSFSSPASNDAMVVSEFSGTSFSSLAAPAPAAPGGPTINSFTASPTLIAPAGTSTLSWNVTNANSLTINPGGISTTTLVGSIAVHPTTTTTYTLTATKGSQTATATTTVAVATAPTAPGSFALTNLGTSTADLGWTASTPNNGATILYYNLYRGTSLSAMPRIGTTTGLSYHDTGLATSTLYYWYAAAVDSVGNLSPSSTIASGTTQSGITPTIASFTATPDVVAVAGTSTLSWSVTGATSLTLDPLGITTTTFTGSLDVHPTTTTVYTLNATNVHGTYSESRTVTVDDVPPSVPTGITAVGVSSSEIDLSWATSTDANGVAGYRIFRDGNFLATTASTSYQDVGLLPSVLYIYNLTAFDAVGNVSATSSDAVALTLAAPTSTPVNGGTTAVGVVSSGGDRSFVGRISPFAPVPGSGTAGAPIPTSAEIVAQRVLILKNIISQVSGQGIPLPSSTLHFAGLMQHMTSSTDPFVRNFGLSAIGSDVGYLQQFLIFENAGPAAAALAAAGPTGYFGRLTRDAVVEFQQRVGIIPASGYFGAITRNYVNFVL